MSSDCSALVLVMIDILREYITKRDDVTFIEYSSWRLAPLTRAKIQGKSWGHKLNK